MNLLKKPVDQPSSRTNLTEQVRETHAQTLTVFLLSHNRVKTAIEAAESILEQTDSRFHFVISDSSESRGDRLKIEDFCKLKDIEIRRRKPTTSAAEHWWACVEECETDYLILFHDDDLMLPGFVREFWNFKLKIKSFSAAGFNAQVKNFDGTVCTSFANKKRIIGPISASTLIDNYFLKFSLGIAPFPSYVYYRRDLKRPIESQGKYGDVCLLLRLAAKGELYWVNTKVMIYRLHGDNDGLSESVTDRLRLLSFLKMRRDWFSKFNLLTYRYFLYRKIRATSRRTVHRRIRRFMYTYPLVRLTSTKYWYNLISRKLLNPDDLSI